MNWMKHLLEAHEAAWSCTVYTSRVCVHVSESLKQHRYKVKFACANKQLREWQKITLRCEGRCWHQRQGRWRWDSRGKNWLQLTRSTKLGRVHWTQTFGDCDRHVPEVVWLVTDSQSSSHDQRQICQAPSTECQQTFSREHEDQETKLERHHSRRSECHLTDAGGLEWDHKEPRTVKQLRWPMCWKHVLPWNTNIDIITCK